MDAELRVGSVEETITVTGEAPIVDTSSLTKQQVLNSELVDALPSARNYVTLARMVAGTNASGNGANDVGGSQIQDVGGSLTVHGSRTTDQRVTANGINTMTLQAGGNIGGQTPGRRFRCRGHHRHDLAVGGSADRRRAHQLHPARRRQPIRHLRVLQLRQRAACRATTFPTS